MKINTKNITSRLIVTCLASALIIGLAMTAGAGGEEVTLIGEINDTFQLVAGGNIYDVAETPEGEDLVRNYISVKVKVTGTVQKGEETDVITVRSYETVDE